MREPAVTEKNKILHNIKLLITDVDGVLTDGRIGFSSDGSQTRFYSVHDGMGLALWHSAGHGSAMLSGNGGDSISNVAAQWKCSHCYMFSKNKLNEALALAELHQVSLEQVAFIGDDIIDLELLEAVGFAATVPTAPDSLRRAADLVTERDGGAGALRELINHILAAQGQLDRATTNYLQARAANSES